MDDRNQKLSQEDMQRQKEALQTLVNTAFNDGLVKAIDDARKMKDAYILDAFHDLLVDRLYKELVERNKLEEL